MALNNKYMEALISELNKLHARHELAEQVAPDYFEPGMMEYLDKSDGIYDEAAGTVELRFESKGTRYGDRTEQIESLSVGDQLHVERDPDNQYNGNNFIIKTEKDKDVGNMPAELCNAIAPLYDSGMLEITESKVSFVEPISKRSRHAKQAILFIDLKCRVTCN